jgi:hypothetical protein
VVLSIRGWVVGMPAMMGGMAIAMCMVRMTVLMAIMASKITMINTRMVVPVTVGMGVMPMAIWFLVIMGKWVMMA